jgi:hypothetical protein
VSLSVRFNSNPTMIHGSADISPTAPTIVNLSPTAAPTSLDRSYSTTDSTPVILGCVIGVGGGLIVGFALAYYCLGRRQSRVSAPVEAPGITEAYRTSTVEEAYRGPIAKPPPNCDLSQEAYRTSTVEEAYRGPIAKPPPNCDLSQEAYRTSSVEEAYRGPTIAKPPLNCDLGQDARESFEIGQVYGGRPTHV